MEFLNLDFLAFAWLGIIGFGVILYIILDGFGLGIGIVSPLFKDAHEKDLIVSTILPVWDGNETWLVFVGATLYGAFPLAFSTILPALYIPILIMIIALLFRGSSMEFRLKAHRSRAIWNASFFLGSLFATIAQGLIIASLLTGFNVPNEYASFSFYQWLNPFSLFCALSLVVGYALLGSNRLIIKTSGKIQEKCYRLSTMLQWFSLVCIVIVVLWTQIANPDIKQVWFHSVRSPLFIFLLVLGVSLFMAHLLGLRNKQENSPYWLLIGLFLIAYIGLLASIFPYLIPRKLTYLEAAADPHALMFMLIGAVIILPILLYYTYYSYKIFRGKAHEKIEY
jgi:cytochrome d ubiquinol oxidase subunit II